LEPHTIASSPSSCQDPVAATVYAPACPRRRPPASPAALVCPVPPLGGLIPFVVPTFISVSYANSCKQMTSWRESWICARSAFVDAYFDRPPLMIPIGNPTTTRSKTFCCWWWCRTYTTKRTGRRRGEDQPSAASASRTIEQWARRC
jgi:hypothetical protein